MTLDSSNRPRATASLTVSAINKGAVYGNLGNDTMVVSNNAERQLYGGEATTAQMALMTSGLAEGGSGADTFILSGSLKAAAFWRRLYIFDGGDLMSVAGGISAGAAWQSGNDSVVVAAASEKATLFGGQGNDSSPAAVTCSITSVASVQTHSGCFDLTSSTVYGDQNSTSSHWVVLFNSLVVGNATESYIYANVGNDRVSLAAGLIKGSIYGGSGDDSLYVVSGASTSALIDGGVGNDFLSLGGG